METDPFPAIFMADIEYSVIKSDAIKSFDCTGSTQEDPSLFN